jgi:hypothetical protein
LREREREKEREREREREREGGREREALHRLDLLVHLQGSARRGDTAEGKAGF